MIIKDSEKEFDTYSKISYGIDGDKDIRDKDFTNVKGSFNDNSFVIELRNEINATSSE